MKRAIPPLFWPPLWMVVIFICSTDLGSMENTRGFLVSLLRWGLPGATPTALRACLLFIRKSAHLMEYAILSALWFFALSKSASRSAWRSAGLALGISCLYAGLDEVHHALLASRTGSFVDVGIDSFGAFAGLTFWKGRGPLSSEARIKLKYFGWWFAWGIFSSIMLLTITRGASLSVVQMLLVMLGIGTIAGLAGVASYVRRR